MISNEEENAARSLSNYPRTSQGTKDASQETMPSSWRHGDKLMCSDIWKLEVVSAQTRLIIHLLIYWIAEASILVSASAVAHICKGKALITFANFSLFHLCFAIPTGEWLQRRFLACALIQSLFIRRQSFTRLTNDSWSLVQDKTYKRNSWLRLIVPRTKVLLDFVSHSLTVTDRIIGIYDLFLIQT